MSTNSRQMEDKKVSKKFQCLNCDYSTSRNSQWERHLITAKHLKATKIDKKFQCLNCDYQTSRNSQWERHLLTVKHINATSVDKIVPHHMFKCPCGLEYKCRQTLWKHKKSCGGTKVPKSSETKFQKVDTNNEETKLKVLTHLVKDVIKQNINVIEQNQVLTNKIVDICKIGQNSISHNNIHSNNKTFNLQLFLNETCKDAMNISDFVESIKFQLKDLEHIGEVGFVEGISDVVLDNLTELDTRQRPIHCSDNKREILYIKDNNEWVKDDEPNTKMSNVIKQIASKNIKIIPEWIKNNPDCHKYESKKNDKYLKILSNSMSGGTELEQKTNISKIISKVAKEVTIDKNKFQLK